jgi:hypothetical protein
LTRIGSSMGGGRSSNSIARNRTAQNSRMLASHSSARSRGACRDADL